MSLRIVLLTRTSRPSGAQMAWRLVRAGMSPVAVIVEKRGRMIGKKKKNIFAVFQDFGFEFLWKRIREALQIRLHFYFRWFLGRRFKSPVYLSIEEWAIDHPQIPVHEVPDHNGPECRRLLAGLRPDIGILTNTRRIKKEILEIPRHGFFNLHLSALPQYAGLDSIFWALYHGEKEIGVTVHFAAEEIDRGDVVLQKKIPVSRFDDEENLYQKALWLGTFLTTEAVKQLETGTLERKTQDRTLASYFSWPAASERKEFHRRQKESNPQSSGMPRILHLITRMTRGGAQENTLATVRGLRDKGYEVALLTGSSWGDEGEILSEALNEGLEVALIPELEREIRPLKDLHVFAKLAAWFSKDRFVLIHTHTSKAGFLGRLAARRAGVLAVVHTPHGHVFHSYFSPWKEKFFLGLERMTAKGSDRLIALTEKCRAEHLELGVGTPSRWITIPSGVDEKKFLESAGESKKIPAGKNIIGFVGRLAPVKGALYLVEAMPKIFQSFPDAHCVLVGDGGEKSKIENRIQELNLGNAVTLAGHQKDIAARISAFDILAVPSLNEGMGRVIVEAGFLGKAVVGSRVGGIVDLIEDEKTGLLVKSRSSDEIAAAVIRLLRDAGFRKQMGEELRLKVLRGFTEDQMVEKIDRLYREVLAEKGITVESRETVDSKLRLALLSPSEEG